MDNDDNLTPVPVYDVDEDTMELLEAALNCLVTLSESQLDENSAVALIAIADALADRFGINRHELEETTFRTDDGEEEIIYKPKGGVMNDEDDTAQD
jgi:exonuclease V gamma subunit